MGQWFFRTGVAVVASGLFAGCGSFPETADRAWPIISAREEQAAAALLRAEAARRRAELEQRLQEVGRRLMAVVPDVPPCAFQVTESNEVNAYAGRGVIEVSLGLLRFLRTKDELAVVVGHELAHEVLTASGKVGQRSRSDVEREADLLGLTYTHRAGYDVSAAADLWERMAVELPGALSESWLAHHPSFPERLVLARKIAAVLRGQATVPAGSAGPREGPPQAAPLPADFGITP